MKSKKIAKIPAKILLPLASFSMIIPVSANLVVESKNDTKEVSKTNSLSKNLVANYKTKAISAFLNVNRNDTPSENAETVTANTEEVQASNFQEVVDKIRALSHLNQNEKSIYINEAQKAKEVDASKVDLNAYYEIARIQDKINQIAHALENTENAFEYPNKAQINILELNQNSDAYKSFYLIDEQMKQEINRDKYIKLEIRVVKNGSSTNNKDNPNEDDKFYGRTRVTFLVKYDLRNYNAEYADIVHKIGISGMHSHPTNWSKANFASESNDVSTSNFITGFQRYTQEEQERINNIQLSFEYKNTSIPREQRLYPSDINIYNFRDHFLIKNGNNIFTEESEELIINELIPYDENLGILTIKYSLRSKKDPSIISPEKDKNSQPELRFWTRNEYIAEVKRLENLNNKQKTLFANYNIADKNVTPTREDVINQVEKAKLVDQKMYELKVAFNDSANDYEVAKENSELETNKKFLKQYEKAKQLLNKNSGDGVIEVSQIQYIIDMLKDVRNITSKEKAKIKIGQDKRLTTEQKNRLKQQVHDLNEPYNEGVSIPEDILEFHDNLNEIVNKGDAIDEITNSNLTPKQKEDLIEDILNANVDDDVNWRNKQNRFEITNENINKKKEAYERINNTPDSLLTVQDKEKLVENVENNNPIDQTFDHVSSNIDKKQEAITKVKQDSNLTEQQKNQINENIHNLDPKDVNFENKLANELAKAKLIAEIQKDPVLTNDQKDKLISEVILLPNNSELSALLERVKSKVDLIKQITNNTILDDQLKDKLQKQVINNKADSNTFENKQNELKNRIIDLQDLIKSLNDLIDFTNDPKWNKITKQSQQAILDAISATKQILSNSDDSSNSQIQEQTNINRSLLSGYKKSWNKLWLLTLLIFLIPFLWWFFIIWKRIKKEEEEEPQNIEAN
ncbi:hypothetical protein [Mycoplasmopsis glycophila]|uniref:Protein G-related albumin-binding (GA) module domain-containing protein n=1 Tax=Mycoplasmopsis glycophila TaxID=171285 RepID=A0A449AWQ6_9BACT|nr:hypothetical protein [Mycoplasmopsis glycophila]VEU71180.1 Uncharacterised protein [Mycoplasmopsis glycophila]